jgi:hypothetical protein
MKRQERSTQTKEASPCMVLRGLAVVLLLRGGDHPSKQVHGPSGPRCRTTYQGAQADSKYLGRRGARPRRVWWFSRSRGVTSPLTRATSCSCNLVNPHPNLGGSLVPSDRWPLTAARGLGTAEEAWLFLQNRHICDVPYILLARSLT